MSSAVEPEPIGGFLPFELPSVRGVLPPAGAQLFRSGRGCLYAILSALRPARLYVPFYICNSAFAPAAELGIPVTFYAISRDLKPILPEIDSSSCVLVVDYFGVNAAASEPFVRLGDRLIVDQTHALFAPRLEACWSFTSARKWFGVPDGAFLFGPRSLEVEPACRLGTAPGHLIERRWGDPAAAYAQFIAAEERLPVVAEPISQESVAMLRGIDAELVMDVRRRNFDYLHAKLAMHNELRCNTRSIDDVPFCYPFMPSFRIERAALVKEKLFVPQLWRDCLDRAGDDFIWERELADRVLPLPVDHRYGTTHMDRIVAVISGLLHDARDS